MRQIRIASGTAAINPPITPRRKFGKVFSRNATVPESRISRSRKVTVIQVTSNLNSETAITIRIDPSESTADISGRRRIDRKNRLSPIQVRVASVRWKISCSVANNVPSATR